MRSILYPLWILFISVSSVEQMQPNNFRAEYIAPCCATVAGDAISLLNCSLHASSANTELLKLHPKTFRLAVTMYATVDISVYSAYSFAINEAYCEYYGCAFIYQDSREVNHEPRDARWNKIKILSEALEKWENVYDYVLWVDADLVIIDMNFDVRKLISTSAHADIWVSAESAGSSTLINSGSILVKNSEFSRAFLIDWWGSSDDRLYYSDQEQFDILYNKLGDRKRNIVILAPDALNSDPPAMTKQKRNDQVLHLMGEHNEFREYAFTSGWQEICSFLHNKDDSSRFLQPQLTMTQENLLLWTIDLYSQELQLILPVYREKAASGENGLDATDKLANAIHHLAHALEHRNLPGDRARAHDLRKSSFDLLDKNLASKRFFNDLHISKHGKSMIEWPELVKKTAVSGLHMVESGSYVERKLAGESVRVLLDELVRSCHVAQRPAVLQMVTYLEHHLGVLELSESKYSEALVHFELAYDISLKLSYQIGRHILEEPLSSLANILAISGQYDRAYELYDDLIAITEQSLGSKAHERLLTHHFNAALAFYNGGQAYKCCLEVLKIQDILKELDIKNYIHNSLLVNMFQDSKCSQTGPSRVQHSTLSMNQKDILGDEFHVTTISADNAAGKIKDDNPRRIIMKRRKVNLQQY